MPEIKYWSLHQFGLALDVRGVDIDGKNSITTALDRREMAEAAEEHADASWTKHNYSDGHVHAQWGVVRNAPGGTSTSSQRSTQTSTTNTENPVTTPPETTSTTVPGACGVHTIAASESSDHEETTGACGDTYYVCSQADHALQASCSTDSSCISTNFYLCQHTSHTYLVSCARRHCNIMLSNAYEHSVICTGCENRYWTCPTAAGRNHHTWISSCGSTDSNGNTCTNSSGYYKCSPHTHSYPSANNNDGNSGDSGDSGNGNVNSDTVTCAAGHSYRSDHPNRAYLDTLHRTRTCRRKACGRSWECCVSGWAPAGCPAAPGYVCWGTDE